MNVQDTVLDLISSHAYKPSELINVDSTLGDQGVKSDMVEIKGKLDSKYGINIPIDIMQGKISELNEFSIFKIKTFTSDHSNGDTDDIKLDEDDNIITGGNDDEDIKIYMILIVE